VLGLGLLFVGISPTQHQSSPGQFTDAKKSGFQNSSGAVTPFRVTPLNRSRQSKVVKEICTSVNQLEKRKLQIQKIIKNEKARKQLCMLSDYLIS
jgi:hypothetical protein